MKNITADKISELLGSSRVSGMAILNSGILERGVEIQMPEFMCLPGSFNSPNPPRARLVTIIGGASLTGTYHPQSVDITEEILAVIRAMERMK
jgi:hypothetical protein